MPRSFATGTAVAALLALTLPAAAQEKAAADPPQQQQQRRQGEAGRDSRQAQPQTQARLRVVPAAEMIGREVRADGQAVGQVAFVMVDARDATTRYVIVDRGQDGGDGMTVVPWNVVENVPGSGPITLSAPAEQLARAPRIQPEELASLTTPTAVTRIVTFYATPQQPQQQGQAGGPATPGGTPPQPATPPAGQPQAQPAAPGEQGAPHLLVGRQIVTMIQEPDFRFARQIAGDQVVTAAGQPVGTIDQMMIDADTGRVAFVLVAQGGFLGMGEEWTPMPFQPMQWNTDRQAYVIDDSKIKGQAMKSFPRQARLPAAVRREDLARLYQQFGAEPYWQ